MNVPQRNDAVSGPQLIQELNDRINQLTDLVRRNNPQQSPTVRADVTALGTTYHVIPSIQQTAPILPKLTWAP